MFPVGSTVYVLLKDGSWHSARVLMHKKQGWHLLVTDEGKEMSRQACDIMRTPLAAFEQEIRWATGRVLRASDAMQLADYSRDSLDAFHAAQKNCAADCALAALWFLKLSDAPLESRKKMYALYSELGAK